MEFIGKMIYFFDGIPQNHDFRHFFYYFFDIWASGMTLEARVSFFDTNLTRRTHPQHAESNKNKRLLRNNQLILIILSSFESPMGPLGPLGPLNE